MYDTPSSGAYCHHLTFFVSHGNIKPVHEGYLSAITETRIREDREVFQLHKHKMSQSGVKVADEVYTTYNLMKTKSTYGFALFRMNSDCSRIVLDEEHPPVDSNLGLAELKEVLGEKFVNEPRYALLDYKWDVKETTGNRKQQKLILISWVPDTAKVKHKMLYSSSLEALLRGFEGCKKHQASELGELEEKEIRETAASK